MGTRTQYCKERDPTPLGSRSRNIFGGFASRYFCTQLYCICFIRVLMSLGYIGSQAIHLWSTSFNHMSTQHKHNKVENCRKGSVSTSPNKYRSLQERKKRAHIRCKLHSCFYSKNIRVDEAWKSQKNNIRWFFHPFQHQRAFFAAVIDLGKADDSLRWIYFVFSHIIALPGINFFPHWDLMFVDGPAIWKGSISRRVNRSSKSASTAPPRVRFRLLRDCVRILENDPSSCD